MGVNDCIAFLNGTGDDHTGNNIHHVAIKAQSVKIREELTNAAQAHANDVGNRKYKNDAHRGSKPENRTSDNRIRKQNSKWRPVKTGEAIGYEVDARTLVINLLVDDGKDGTPHRYGLLDPNWQYVGFGWSTHSVVKGICEPAAENQKNGNIVVIDYAGENRHTWPIVIKKPQSTLKPTRKKPVQEE